MFWNETNLYWISYNFSNYSFHNCPWFRAKCLDGVSLNHCFQDALPCSRKLAKAKVTEASWYNKVSVLTSLYGMSLAYSHDWYPIKYIHLAIQCLIFIVAGMYVICFWIVLNKRPVILKFLNKNLSYRCSQFRKEVSKCCVTHSGCPVMFWRIGGSEGVHVAIIICYVFGLWPLLVNNEIDTSVI